jgi:hypothetical protein
MNPATRAQNQLVNLARLADEVLRRGSAAAGLGRSSSAVAASRLLLLIVLFGLAYGGVMGTYGGLAADRPWQVVYSSVKVPILLLATFGLSLPSFFVLNTILGLRDDFGRVVGALLATQAALTLILCSLAPITAFWYACGSAYQPAILFNGLVFGVASFSAQTVLRREYVPLIARNPAHRGMLWGWIFIYVFVGIQMGWTLRPFIGDPAHPVQFFREGSWSNAYEVVIQMIWKNLTGRM